MYNKEQRNGAHTVLTFLPPKLARRINGGGGDGHRQHDAQLVELAVRGLHGAVWDPVERVEAQRWVVETVLREEMSAGDRLKAGAVALVLERIPRITGYFFRVMAAAVTAAAAANQVRARPRHMSIRMRAKSIVAQRCGSPGPRNRGPFNGVMFTLAMVAGETLSGGEVSVPAGETKGTSPSSQLHGRVLLLLQRGTKPRTCLPSCQRR